MIKTLRGLLWCAGVFMGLTAAVLIAVESFLPACIDGHALLGPSILTTLASLAVDASF
ncbi:MAG TPA: hypothetical protein VF336_06300 [Syntrophales bacterium]